MEAVMNIIAICKDCGNGTLNGILNPQFILYDDVILCMNCSSSHVDVVSVTTEEPEEDAAFYVDDSPFSDEPYERESGV
jgi:hypothetical protein